MKLLNIICVILVLLVTYIHAVVATPNKQALGAAVRCPNYQRKCPDCKDTETCIYPNSGGCEGAGIPVCKPKDCHHILCLTKILPCPQYCPFTCNYEKGPSCCPFDGNPVCETDCQTFAPCQETPCPAECPNDCFYPNADYCCPLSGQPVCR